MARLPFLHICTKKWTKIYMHTPKWQLEKKRGRNTHRHNYLKQTLETCPTNAQQKRQLTLRWDTLKSSAVRKNARSWWWLVPTSSRLILLTNWLSILSRFVTLSCKIIDVRSWREADFCKITDTTSVWDIEMIDVNIANKMGECEFEYRQNELVNKTGMWIWTWTEWISEQNSNTERHQILMV